MVVVVSKDSFSNGLESPPDIFLLAPPNIFLLAQVGEEFVP